MQFQLQLLVGLPKKKTAKLRHLILFPELHTEHHWRCSKSHNYNQTMYCLLFCIQILTHWKCYNSKIWHKSLLCIWVYTFPTDLELIKLVGSSDWLQNSSIPMGNTNLIIKNWNGFKFKWGFTSNAFNKIDIGQMGLCKMDMALDGFCFKWFYTKWRWVGI